MSNLTLSQDLLATHPAARDCLIVAVSVENVCTMSDCAACAVAHPSHNYFWDPAGSPAPTRSYQTYMPEVMGGCLARQCTSHEVCASEFASRSVGIIDYMVMCCLVTSLCAFLWQIVPIATMPIMAYERVQRFARKAMTPFFWSSLFLEPTARSGFCRHVLLAECV